MKGYSTRGDERQFRRARENPVRGSSELDRMDAIGSLALGRERALLGSGPFRRSQVPDEPREAL